MLDELLPARVRAGWTLPATLTGLVAAAAGGWLVHSTAQANMACDLFGALESIRGFGHPQIVCGGISFRYNAGGALVASGALLALVALFVAGRRGRAAARQGHPWPLRRFLTRIAHWVDRRLPGSSETHPPRISASAISALLSCLLLVGLVTVHSAWREHQRNAELAHRHAAERALASLVLPTGVTREAKSGDGCTPSADTLCASSGHSMEQLRPVMESLLTGRTSTAMCNFLTQPKGMSCPLTVYGKIAGYRAVATVFRHLLIVKDGEPPAGAEPLRPGTRRGVFFLGTDVNVSLIVPTS